MGTILERAIISFLAGTVPLMSLGSLVVSAEGTAVTSSVLFLVQDEGQGTETKSDQAEVSRIDRDIFCANLQAVIERLALSRQIDTGLSASLGAHGRNACIHIDQSRQKPALTEIHAALRSLALASPARATGVAKEFLMGLFGILADFALDTGRRKGCTVGPPTIISRDPAPPPGTDVFTDPNRTIVFDAGFKNNRWSSSQQVFANAAGQSAKMKVRWKVRATTTAEVTSVSFSLPAELPLLNLPGQPDGFVSVLMKVKFTLDGNTKQFPTVGASPFAGPFTITAGTGGPDNVTKVDAQATFSGLAAGAHAGEIELALDIIITKTSGMAIGAIVTGTAPHCKLSK